MRGRVAIGALVLGVVMATLGACTPLPAPQAASLTSSPTTHDPVVIVPGWALFCLHGSGEWQAWTNAFVKLGYRRDQITIYDYDTCQSNTLTGAGLGQVVDQVLASSGAAKVDLVAHSMGALPARWCVRFGSCAGKVDHLVTMAGANHGTLWADVCSLQFWSQACGDMQAQSPFLAQLNAGSEVVPGVRTSTYESWCDLVIVPFTSGELAGATNHEVSNCIGHDGWKTDPAAIADVTSMLAAANPGPGGGSAR